MQFFASSDRFGDINVSNCLLSKNRSRTRITFFWNDAIRWQMSKSTFTSVVGAHVVSETRQQICAGALRSKLWWRRLTGFATGPIKTTVARQLWLYGFAEDRELNETKLARTAREDNKKPDVELCSNSHTKLAIAPDASAYKAITFG